MGIFGSRTKIYVSSVIYNMAGDYSERINYLKFLVHNGILSPQGRSLGEVVTSGTLNGPRMNYQAYFRWAKKNYPEGMPIGGVYGSTQINPDIITPFIDVPLGMTANADLAEIDFADYYQWAYAYMAENHYELIDSDWGADINEDTYEITIIFEDESTESFEPEGYDPDGRYIYCRYVEVAPPDDPDPQQESAGPDLGPYASSGSLPDTSNHYLLDEIDEFGVNQDRHEITTVTKIYSDGRPSEVNTTKSVIGSRTYDRLVQIFERYTGIEPDSLDESKSFWTISRIYIWEAPSYTTDLVSTNSDVVEIEPGVFETTTTDIYEENFLLSGSSWWAREEEWIQENGYRSEPKVFIYLLGSGNTDLDALEVSINPMDGYFPMIPIRIHNKMINEEPYLNRIYPQAKKAWKRASGSKKIEKLIDQVTDNENLSDIDHAFLVWGVSLNDLTREGKLYIYHFFNTMYENQTDEAEAFEDYLDEAEAYRNYLEALDAYTNSGGEEQTEPPVEPVQPTKVKPPKSTTVRTNGQHIDTEQYDFRLTWNYMTETIVSGKWKPDAKKNEVKIEFGETITIDTSVVGRLTQGLTQLSTKYDSINIYFQENDTQYRILKVVGAVHNNYVYGGKSVQITAKEALEDGDDSGFIVPLHYSIMKKMPIVWANQLATEALHIVFNCYVVVKKKWYQTFLGMIIISLLTMGAGAIFSGGASVMAGGGILGSNIAVGAMFGLSGVAGALAGAALNAIVMTTIMAVVGEVAEKLGPLGAIFAAIAGIVIGSMTGGLLTGGLKFDMTIFFRADNLLKLTNSAISAYSLYTQEKTQDIYAQMRDVEEQYKKSKREIDQLMYELTGFSSGFDPMTLTEVLESGSEDGNSFMERTLMTGSDIAELTQALISQFANHSIDLENLKG